MNDNDNNSYNNNNQPTIDWQSVGSINSVINLGFSLFVVVLFTIAYFYLLRRRYEKIEIDRRKVQQKPSIRLSNDSSFSSSIRWIPYPPNEFDMGNVENLPCRRYPPVECSLTNENVLAACFGCNEFGYRCVHTSHTFFLDEKPVPPHADPTKGYCLPSDLANDINPFTTEALLIKDDRDRIGFAYRCRFPGIFGQTSLYDKCEIFHNPCGENGDYTDRDGTVFDGKKPVWFDPIEDGRCAPHDKSFYKPYHDHVNGPSLLPTTTSDSSILFSRPGLIHVAEHSLDELKNFGYKESIARRLKMLPDTTVPIPCQVDPITGVYNPENRYDADSKRCVCEITRAIGARVDEDLNGNAVDVPNPERPNVCLNIIDETARERKRLDERNVEYYSFAYCNSDHTPTSQVYVDLRQTLDYRWQNVLLDIGVKIDNRLGCFPLYEDWLQSLEPVLTLNPQLHQKSLGGGWLAGSAPTAYYKLWTLGLPEKGFCIAYEKRTPKLKEEGFAWCRDIVNRYVQNPFSKQSMVLYGELCRSGNYLNQVYGSVERKHLFIT